MKIIKHPKPFNWSCQFTCALCKAVLEVDATDLRYHYVEPRDKPPYEVFTANCAVCENDFNVPTQKISVKVKSWVKGAR